MSLENNVVVHSIVSYIQLSRGNFDNGGEGGGGGEGEGKVEAEGGAGEERQTQFIK